MAKALAPLAHISILQQLVAANGCIGGDLVDENLLLRYRVSRDFYAIGRR